MSSLPTLPNPAGEKTMLRLIVCGSVDDGKSTLIGRLLFDSRAVHEDQLAHIAEASKRRGGSAVDLSLLTDGLRAERQQGITIDVAYRFFSTAHRDFVLIDAPGHEQYTCNMATGASQADVAVILLDASRGMTLQTKRHAYLVNLLEIPAVVFAVNKMDLVGYDRETFERHVREMNDWCRSVFGERRAKYLPVSALDGDNVVRKAEHMPWYDGPSLLEYLEQLNPRIEASEHARMFVQTVIRPSEFSSRGYRGYAGRMASGSFAVGDAVALLPAGTTTKISALERYGEPVERVVEGQSATLFLSDDMDVSRGELICGASDWAECADSVRASLVWTGSTPLNLDRWYALRIGSRWLRARVTHVSAAARGAEVLRQTEGPVSYNDIVSARLQCSETLAYDPYSKNRVTGAFILVDEQSHETAAAGMLSLGESRETVGETGGHRASLWLLVGTSWREVGQGVARQVLDSLRAKTQAQEGRAIPAEEGRILSTAELMTHDFEPKLGTDGQLTVVTTGGGWHGGTASYPPARELAARLSCPIILIVQLQRGCFNQTKLTLDAIEREGHRVHGWLAVRPAGSELQKVNEEFFRLQQSCRPPLLGVLEMADERRRGDE